VVTWTLGERQLLIEDDTVRLLPDGFACTGEELLTGVHDDAVLSAFDLATLAEAHAVLRDARLPPERRLPPADPAPLTDRPSIRWDRHQSRKGLIWFFGRSIAVDVSGQPRVTITLAEAAAGGLEPWRSALGGAMIDDATEDARRLAPLPCFCGTNCQRTHEHDALMHLIRIQHPYATIDYSATTTRCRVCGRWWTFEELGDSHYSYQYRVRQLLV
jgi:hypothetical protein